MSRKFIFILSVLIIIVAIVAGGVIFLKNQSDKETISKPEDNSSNYYVETGAEDYATIVKPAVESYATQDVSESSTSRNKRMAAYFTTDSPVFSRDIEIRTTNSAIKTTATATSVTFSAGQSPYQTLIVKVDVTSYAGSNSSTASQTYWVTIKKNSDGSYSANDIGLLNE